MRSIYTRHRFLLAAITLSAVLPAILFFAFGFYYEVYENYIANITAATFTDPPSHLWISTIHMFLFPVYAKIQQWFPSIPALGITGLLLIFCLLLASYHFLYSIFKDQISWRKFVLISTLLIIILLSDSIIQFNSPRLSILITAVVMLILLHNTYSNKLLVLLFILLFFGCLMRVQTAFATAVFILSVFVAWRLPGRDLLKKLAPAIVVITFLLLVYQTGRHYAHNFGVTIEDRYEYAITDRQELVPLSEMKNKEDSLKYMAVQQFMLNDSAKLDSAFLERVVTHHPLKDLLSNPELLKKRMSSTFEQLFFFSSYFKFRILFLLLLAVTGIFLSYNKVETFRNHFTVLAILFLLLAGLTSVVTMVFYIFSPLLSVAAFLQIYLIATTERTVKVNARTQFIIAVVALVIFTVPAINMLAAIDRDNKEMYRSYLDISSNLKKESEGKLPVMLGIHTQIFNNNVFGHEDRQLLSKLILPDVCYMDYYSFLKDRYTRLYGFNATDMGSIGNFLLNNRDGIVIYSRESRARFIQQYLQGVHHLPISFVAIRPAKGDDSEKWFYYKVEKGDSIVPAANY